MDNLSQKESDLLLRCLKACIDELFFPDWEFHTLTGYDKADVATLVKKWPDINLEDPATKPLVLNILNNLLGYPHGVAEEQWNKSINASTDRLRELWSKVNIE